MAAVTEFLVSHDREEDSMHRPSWAVLIDCKASIVSDFPWFSLVKTMRLRAPRQPSRF
jgi:hypothetical protein